MRRSIAILLFILGGILLLWGGNKLRINARMRSTRFTRMLPEMQQKITALLSKAQAEGIPVKFWEGWRSAEDEQADIESGASKLKDPYNTVHLWGAASDIAFDEDLPWVIGQPDANDPRWQRLIEIGKSVGLDHPISWDMPHFQLPGYLPADIRSIRADYGKNYTAYITDNGGTFA